MKTQPTEWKTTAFADHTGQDRRLMSRICEDKHELNFKISPHQGREGLMKGTKFSEEIKMTKSTQKMHSMLAIKKTSRRAGERDSSAIMSTC